VVVLDGGGVDDHHEDQPERIDEQAALAAEEPLTAVVAPRPPFSVVLTDWLSRIAADGCRSRPSARRRSPRSSSWSRSSVPSPFQLRKYEYTPSQGKKSWGDARRWQPVRAMYSGASTI
jgi:hypothetical protein